VEIEHLTQLHDGREVDQPLVFQFRSQFIFGFTLRFAGDRAEETAGSFLESFDGAIGKRVAFLAPKFPTDVARHIFGIEFQAIQHDACGLHDIVANAVTGHPCDFICSHRIATLSTSVIGRKFRWSRRNGVR
jgi:hypothetical protein